MHRQGRRAKLRCMPSPGSASLWQMPRLRREGRWLGGVAQALAVEIGVEPLVLRLAFVLLALAGGLGLALYASAWLVFTYARPSSEYHPIPKARSPQRRLLGVALVVLGLIVWARQVLPTGVEQSTFWPVAVAALGLLLAWSTGKLGWSEPRELARAAGGLLLIAGGVISFIVLNLRRADTPRALLIAMGALSLVVTIVAPWLWRAASQEGEARMARARAVERAEVAAHLHDSVLQTLTLIHLGADDPVRTRQLARRQERDLRRWLADETPRDNRPTRFRGALLELAAEVEDLHGVPVEAVVVGDGPLLAPLVSLLAACREALVNAARHSGAGSIDLYGEWGKEAVEVFVRDKGVGFEPSGVPIDRRGLSESIVGRMLRAGGRGTVQSQPGKGTEVSLEWDLAQGGTGASGHAKE